MKTEQVDVLVIGAGPAGSVAASIIHQAGYKVMVVEKMRFPRFVIGESLLPRSMEALEEAGFIDAIRAKGFQQKSGAKFVKGNAVCDFTFKEQYTPGYTWTWQVTLADFDKTLADTVESMGVPVRYETTVTNIYVIVLFIFSFIIQAAITKSKMPVAINRDISTKCSCVSPCTFAPSRSIRSAYS